MEFVKSTVEIVKKVDDIKKKADVITVDKDENFGGALLKGQFKKGLSDRLKSYFDSKEENYLKQIDKNENLDNINENNKIEINQKPRTLGEMLDEFFKRKEEPVEINNGVSNNSNEISNCINDHLEVNYNENNIKDTKVSENEEDSSELSEEIEESSLSEEEKSKIKEETGWSDDIIDAIGSMDEYNIYNEAGLQEAVIDGKRCLVRSDINMDQKDEFGRNNSERMKNGQPPITKNMETVELHHIGQKHSSPLAELTTKEHRGVGNDTILHDKQKESEIDRNAFKKERELHWQHRVND